MRAQPYQRLRVSFSHFPGHGIAPASHRLHNNLRRRRPASLLPVGVKRVPERENHPQGLEGLFI
jgi:hypothetical protein